MSEANYIDHILPTPFVLLGLKLRPLGVGHVLWLMRFDCWPVVTNDQLVTATLICSHHCEDVEETMADRWLGLKLCIWRTRLGKIDWEKKHALFSGYVKEHFRAPSVINKSDRDGMPTSGIPFLFHVKVVLQSKLGYTHDDAMNVPISRALLEYYGWAEMEGSVEVANRERRAEARRWADENAAELIATVERSRRNN